MATLLAGLGDADEEPLKLALLSLLSHVVARDPGAFQEVPLRLNSVHSAFLSHRWSSVSANPTPVEGVGHGGQRQLWRYGEDEGPTWRATM